MVPGIIANRIKQSSSWILIILLIAVTFSPQHLVAQSLGLFESEELLPVKIETDIGHLLKMTKEDKYKKAKLVIGNEEWKIRVRPRGNNRLETCSFPPVTLNFSKTEFSDTSYNQLKKLKLVNTCKLQATYEQYILREYLVYKIFNLLTDYSFKVRLLKIEYIDSKGKHKPIERFGFVIEDANMLARRHNGYVLKQQGLKDEATNRQQMVLLSVFQYMIGNTDWQVAALQNLKLIKVLDFAHPEPYAVPYDFDYTGMVDPIYAVPADMLGIERITQRLYWGQCYSEDELQMAINIFVDKKEEIYAMYREFPYFNKASLNHSLSYLDSFFKVVENEKSWKYHFVKQCKNK